MLCAMINNTIISDNIIMIVNISKAELLGRTRSCLAKPFLFRSSAVWDYRSRVNGKSISSWWDLTFTAVSQDHSSS